MRTNANASERLAAGPAHLLTIEQAATRLGCGRTTAFELIRVGALPSTKIGRRRMVPLAAVDEYLARQP